MADQLGSTNDSLDVTGSGSIRFLVSGTERVFLNASGNLGIGTSGPSYAVDIRRTSGVSGINSETTDTGSFAFNRIGSDGGQLWNISRGSAATGTTFGVSNADSAQVYASGQNLSIGTLNTGDLTLGTSNVGRMTITNSGNVGVITTTPSYDFHVKRTSGSAVMAVDTLDTTGYCLNWSRANVATLDNRAYGSAAVGTLFGSGRSNLTASYAVNASVYAVGTSNGAPLILGTNNQPRFIIEGDGTIKFGTHTADGAAVVDGYITIKDSAGTVRKLATVA